MEATKKATKLKVEHSPTIRVWIHNKRTEDRLFESTFVNRKGQTYGPGAEWRVELLGFDVAGILLEVPGQFCKMGDPLTLTLSARQESNANEIEIVAKVIEYVPLGPPERASVKLEFQRYDQEKWKAFCATFEQHQLGVEQIFNRLKD